MAFHHIGTECEVFHCLTETEVVMLAGKNFSHIFYFTLAAGYDKKKGLEFYTAWDSAKNGTVLFFFCDVISNTTLENGNRFFSGFIGIQKLNHDTTLQESIGVTPDVGHVITCPTWKAIWPISE